MAQYKVPQDVEAEDKLLGPFTARQMLYLGISAASFFVTFFIGTGIGIAGFLISIPLVLVGLFFLALALPLRKDQPTETYLVALINFHFIKPQKRFWNPGQRDSTILITAPKKAEGPYIRTIDEREANNRLGFLSRIVDSEGRSIKYTSIQDDYIEEANTAPDMYSNPTSDRIAQRLNTQSSQQHALAVDQMKAALNSAHDITSTTPPTIHKGYTPQQNSNSIYNNPTPQTPSPAKQAAITELSQNNDFTVATIAQQAKRINHASDDEIYISLH